jgi:hypothetical protein
MAQAQERITNAAKQLATKFSLPAEVVDGLNIQERDPAVKPIKTAEAVAVLLEEILRAQKVADDPAAKKKQSVKSQ